MPQEKRTSLNFSVVKDGQTSQIALTRTEDLAGTDFGTLTQSVGTGAWVALSLGNVSPVDLLLVRNDDATNYVQLSLDNAGTKIFAKLTAGRCAFFPPDPTATIYARANAAACTLQILAAEP